MATQHQVIQLHAKDPSLTPAQIAERLGCSSAYVRATARRRRLTLSTSQKPPRPPDDRELGKAARDAGLRTVEAVEAAARAVQS